MTRPAIRSRRRAFSIGFVSYGVTLIAVTNGMTMPSDHSLSQQRRRLLLGSSVGTASSLMITSPIQTAEAARGAAELDLEYYVRDLVGGNRREGTVDASPQPLLGPPRELSPIWSSVLLNSDCSKECLATTLLIQQIQKRQPNTSTNTLEVTIQQQVQSIRSKAANSFSKKSPWKEEILSDEHYFDLTVYAFWKTAAVLLPDFSDRDDFLRQLGRALYQKLLPSLPINRQGAGGRLRPTVPCVKELLSTFQSTNFCTAYRLGELPASNGNSKKKKGDDSSSQGAVFLDEVDEDAYEIGTPVDCLVSVLNAATLGASLQITGEQSRFIPDLCGATLAALWETQLPECKVTWETYFVDPEYRPNPKDYFPNEQLFQFTLTKKK